MRDRGHEFSEDDGMHKFRTEIPNTVIRGIKSRGLSVHAKWLYVYFKSVCGDKAECYRTTSTIAEESGLSRTMVSTGKKELIDKGLIVLTRSKNPNRQPDHVRIKNIWDANMQEFSVPLANALNEEDGKELKSDEAVSVPLANTKPAQRSISERSVPLANASVLLANQRRSQEEDPSKNDSPPYSPPTAQPADVGVGVERQTVGQLNDPCAARYNQLLKGQAKEVLAYLNVVTGRQHDNVAFIEALLADKINPVSVADCKLVIDWWQAVKIVEQPGQRMNFNASTPFKREKFGDYRAFALEWQANNRSTAGPKQRHTLQM